MPSASLPEIPQNLSALGIFWAACARDIAPMLSHWMLALSTCWKLGLRGRNSSDVVATDAFLPVQPKPKRDPKLRQDSLSFVIP
jgi:hypothetical protein